MKIAIPVDQSNMETNVCPSFGRAPYFLLYDTHTKTGEFLDNSAVASTGGAGIRAAQTVVDAKAQAVLAPRLGMNAADVFKDAGVALYKTTETSLSANLTLLAEGKLPGLDEIHTGFHKHD